MLYSANQNTLEGKAALHQETRAAPGASQANAHVWTPTYQILLQPINTTSPIKEKKQNQIQCHISIAILKINLKIITHDTKNSFHTDSYWN